MRVALAAVADERDDAALLVARQHVGDERERAPDRMIQVPDAASVAAMRLTRELTGRNVGGSTGTNA